MPHLRATQMAQHLDIAAQRISQLVHKGIIDPRALTASMSMQPGSSTSAICVPTLPLTPARC
jgi:hypothetical protein